MRILELSSAPAASTDPPPPPSESPPPPADSPPPPASPSPPPPNQSSPPPPPNQSSPPPPPIRKSPPPPRRSSNARAPPPDLQAEDESAADAWESHKSEVNSHKKSIIGAAVGVGLLFIVIFIICFCRRRRKKRYNRDDDRKKLYEEKPHNSSSNYYTNAGALQTNWGNAATYDAIEKKKYPPPPPTASLSSEHWIPAPPPPPPMMSGELNMSSSFSTGFPRPAPAPAQAPPPPAAAWGGYDKSTFTYNQLAEATSGFSQANLLGQGGFGYVHKGVLPNGQEIAVKSLKLNSGQGEREFQAEVDIISRVHHRHLVSLEGYCISGSKRMLVYEFVPNGTLEEHLHGNSRPCLDCATRLRIALGAAKGFAYLHEDCHPRIIHRDIKAANILLDNNNEAKVADFGLAKLSSDSNTHVSTRIMGTFGYLAPEYASSGKLTEKSDIYSFGIVLLELITGRRPVDLTREDDDTLVDWARPILMRVAEGGSYHEMVDPRLENNYDHGEMLRLLSSAAACIRQSSRRRPKMSQIVRTLEGDVSLDDMHEGMRASHGSLSASSSEYDLQKYQNFASSELGAASGAFSQASSINSNEMNRPSPGDRPRDSGKHSIFHI